MFDLIDPSTGIPTGIKINAFQKGGGGSAPAAVKPKPIPKAAPPVQETAEDTRQAGEDENRQGRKRKGFKSTLLNGNKGVTKSATVLNQELG